MKKILHLTNASKISFLNNKLCINKDEEKHLISPGDILAVVVETLAISITAKTLVELDNHGVLVIFCDERHHPTLQLISPYKFYTLTTRLNEQIKWSDTVKEKISRQIVYYKIRNQNELIEFITGKKNKHLSDAMQKSLVEDNYINQEAVASRTYFRSVFGNRFIRFEDDLANIALNYGYTVLRSLIANVIVAKGLHPALAFTHHSMFNNFNLVDDIIEVFRPLVDFAVYAQVEYYEKFDKDFKQHVLKIITQRVSIGGCIVSLEQSIQKYIDSIIRYANGDCATLDFPSLRIDLYDF